MSKGNELFQKIKEDAWLRLEMEGESAEKIDAVARYVIAEANGLTSYLVKTSQSFAESFVVATSYILKKNISRAKISSLLRHTRAMAKEYGVVVDSSWQFGKGFQAEVTRRAKR